MSGKPFCDCGAKVEWHKTAAGKDIPIDPAPTPLGTYYLDKRMRLVWARAGSRPRMYRCHWDSCPKGKRVATEPRRAPEARGCERWQCDRSDRHRHCFECGSTDHLAEDCPEGA